MFRPGFWTLVILAFGCKAEPASTEPAPAEAPAPATPTEPEPEPGETIFGRSVLSKLQNAKCDQLWGVLGAQSKTVFKTRDAFGKVCKAVATAIAPPTDTLSEDVKANAAGLTTYSVKLKTKNGAAFEVTIKWDRDHLLASMRFKPDGPPKPAPSKYTDYQTQTPLRLPFTTKWTVFWGGRSIAENYHVAYKNQHFAYDLLVMKEGATHAGLGTKNGDYYCFGQNIVAAGAGKVIDTVVGVPDNIPGEMNASQVTGNHVIIEQAHDEYAVYAHLQLGSTKVKNSQQVTQGQLLGRCGNSGNSSEPHLHFHLQDNPVFGEGESMPAQFLDYLADGKPVKRGEPSRLQAIEPAR